MYRSQSPAMTSLFVETDVPIATRDGVKLAATIVRPSGTGRHPAIVMRTPYGRSTHASVSLQVHTLALAEAGYSVVLQDVRGRGGSDGVFTPFVNEQHDGVDTVEWVAEQAWCNGAVGLAGISYNAYAQIATAAAAPNPLGSWIPGLTPFDVRTSWIRRGGVLDAGFHLAWGLGAIASADRRTRNPDELLLAYSDPLRTSRREPPAQSEMAGTPAGSWFFHWARSEDPYRDDRRVPAHGGLSGVSAPALVVAGWFDVFSAGSFELLAALRSEADTMDHRLLVGPWDHSGLPLKRRAGDRDFGIGAGIDLHTVQKQWFDQHLRGGNENEFDRVFITGRNVWVDQERWPPPVEHLNLHLGVDGRLSPETSSGGSLTVTPDPTNPTPAPGGCVFPWEPVLLPGSFDQRSRQGRDDVLVFTGEILRSPLLVVGRPSLRLTLASPGEPVPVYVTLSEASADGPVWNVADGLGQSDPRQGEAVIQLGPIAHEFGTGTSLRLDVAFAADVRLPPPAPDRRVVDLTAGSAVLGLPICG